MAIDVIAQNPVHKEYLDSLCHMKGKYNLDISSNSFKLLYRDTVLKLAERGYLFDDDPELLQIQHEAKGLPLIPGNLAPPTSLEPLSVRPEDAIHFGQPGLFATLPVQASEAAAIDDYELVARFGGFFIRRTTRMASSPTVAIASCFRSCDGSSKRRKPRW